MSPEANKDLIRRFIEAIDNADDWNVVDEFVAADFVTHSPIPGFGSDREGVKQSSAMFKNATPDGRHEILDQVAEGDKVVTRMVGYGTHEGELLGIPSTGKEIRTEGIAIHRVADGKIVEHWNMTDMAGLLQQLGVIPESA